MGLYMKSFNFFNLFLLFIVASSEKQGFFDLIELNQRLMNIDKDCPNSEIIYNRNFDFIGFRIYSYDNHEKKSNILVIGGLHGSLTAAAEVTSFISQFCLSLLSDKYYSQLLYTYNLEFYPVLNSELYKKSYELKETGKKDQIVKTKEDGSCDLDTSFGQNKYQCEEIRLVNFIEGLIEHSTFIINIQDINKNASSDYNLKESDKIVYDKILGKNKKPKRMDNSLVSYVMNYGNKYIFQFKHDLLTELNSKKLSEEFKSEMKDSLGSFVKYLPYPKIEFFDLECKDSENGNEYELKYDLENKYFLNTIVEVNLILAIIKKYWNDQVNLLNAYYHYGCNREKTNYSILKVTKVETKSFSAEEDLQLYSNYTIELVEIPADKCIRMKFTLQSSKKVEFQSNLAAKTLINGVTLNTVSSKTIYHNMIDECAESDELCENKAMIMLLVMLGLLFFMLLFTQYV